MARNKVTIDFKGWEEYAEKLDKLGGTNLLKSGVETGLRVSKEYVNSQLTETIQKSNLPAQGKYSKGDTEKAIDTDLSTTWDGNIGCTKIGFKFDKVGMRSIYLMYGTKATNGTPRMQPVEGLYDAIYGRKTKTKMRKLQKEAINEIIVAHMEG